jgi:predicted Fe-S protein YdhL (DUF1289 family)
MHLCLAGTVCHSLQHLLKLGAHTPLEMIEPELMSRAPPPSPCTKVCTLDAQGFCAGCLRTGAEIGRWMSMSAAQQWQLIEELNARRAQRDQEL